MTDPPSTPSSDADPADGSAVAAEGTADDVAEFERIDWTAVDEGRALPSPEPVALLVGLAALVAVYVHHVLTDQVYLAFRWNVGPADWLALSALVVVLAYGVVPAARNRRETRRVLRRLRRRRLTALALAVVVGVLLVAVVGAVLVRQPELTLDRFQPPVGTSVPYHITQSDCAGPVADGFDSDRPCFGTWEYPLGTDRWGYELTDLLLVGARMVVYATVVTLGLIVPLATTVGLVAGYYGGTVDELLMAYVDVQLAIPAVVVYLVGFMLVGNSLFLLLVAFGLLSWGGIARIVRSETLQRREEGYVLAARSVGASRPYVLRRHLLPNVANSVVPAAFHLIAVLVLTEAALAFVGFHAMFQSWGMTIAEGVFTGPVREVWWASTFPAVALAVTVVALKVAGDGLRDVLDPRGEP